MPLLSGVRAIDEIYGDTNSGNCLKVKWVCDRLALPYTWVGVDTLKRETRTTQFLKLNSAGQVPAVEFDDGRTLAQSNAIIRYLARGSDLIPADAFAAAKMDEWLFWSSTARALCRGVRFQMVYLGKPASDLDPDKIKRGYAALARMEHQLARPGSWSATPSLSPTSRCWPIQGSRMKAAFTSTAMPPCGAGSARPNSLSTCRRRVEIRWNDHGRDFLDHHPPGPPRRRRRHRGDAGRRSAGQRARTARRPAARVVFSGIRGARTRVPYPARGRGR